MANTPTPEEILDKTLDAATEARDLVHMMFQVIMRLPGGSELLLRHLAGDELPKWVTEGPKRVRKR